MAAKQLLLLTWSRDRLSNLVCRRNSCILGVIAIQWRRPALSRRNLLGAAKAKMTKENTGLSSDQTIGQSHVWNNPLSCTCRIITRHYEKMQSSDVSIQATE
jgi:hypothetical protein